MNRLDLGNLGNYIRSRDKLSLLTGIMMLLPAFIIIIWTAFEINALNQNPDNWLIAGSRSIDPVNELIVAYLSRLAPLGLALLIFVTSYLLLESHSLGTKISILLSVSFIAGTIYGIADPILMISIGTPCSVVSILQFISGRKNRRKDNPLVTEKVAKVGLLVAALVCIATLIAIFVYIGARGIKYLSLEFLTSPSIPGGYVEVGQIIAGVKEGSLGGIRDAIIGTGLIVGLCEAIAIPFGLGAAIYLSEYAPKRRFVEVIRFFTETLAGAPSIVLGIFGYAIFCYGLRWGPSLAAGSLALAFMILPWNIRVTEEAIKAVPQSYREAAFALGATKWQAIRKTVLLSASPGMITGIMLGFGAAIGETAVLMWTSTPMGTPGTIPENITLTGVAIPNLAVWIYGAYLNIATGLPTAVNMSYEAQNFTYAGAFVLLILFLIVTGLALLLRNYLAKKTGAIR